MNIAFASVFTDHMVLQQSMNLPVWGTTAPGATVAVHFGPHRVTTSADGSGNWLLRLPPLSASFQPAELKAVAYIPGGESASTTVRDVLVGDVWICSGQSNMQWSVSVSNDPETELSNADHPHIRLLNVPRVGSATPRCEVGASWTECCRDTLSEFSAVGYFFGRELNRRLKVPIGLINSSYGGTLIEAWTSLHGLKSDPVASELLKGFYADLPRLEEARRQWQRDIDAIDQSTADRENLGLARGWAAPAEPSGDWKTMTLPTTWQTAGLNFSGIFWFRKTVDLPQAWAGRDLMLSIGATDKSDLTYFNGRQVGSVTMAQRPDAWSYQRRYPIPGSLASPGKAVVAVRVHSDRYAGGMTGPAPVMYLSCPSLEGEPRIPLSGDWRYAIESNYGVVEMPPMPMAADNPNAPTALYNGMIAPLVPFAVRGAIWYQGESNAGRPRQYRSLMTALIRDWRRLFHEGLAFHIVQLANYGPTSPIPAQNSWAELREAQTMALALPNTGMAVTIDIGDPGDIHPRNKQDVGLRLAWAALNKTHGQKDVPGSSPMFREATPQGAKLRVRFDHADGGLVVRGDALKGFAIAGLDRRFHWATGRVDGDAVILSAPEVPEPRFVRYAWDASPNCNLYSGAGLPACPFRSDGD